MENAGHQGADGPLDNGRSLSEALELQVQAILARPTQAENDVAKLLEVARVNNDDVNIRQATLLLGAAKFFRENTPNA